MTARLIVLAALCWIGFCTCAVGYTMVGGTLEFLAKERWPNRRRLITAVSWIAMSAPGMAVIWLCGGLSIGGGA